MHTRAWHSIWAVQSVNILTWEFLNGCVSLCRRSWVRQYTWSFRSFHPQRFNYLMATNSPWTRIWRRSHLHQRPDDYSLAWHSGSMIYSYISPNSTWLVKSRLDTTRYLSPCILPWEKVVTRRDETCRACRTARRDARHKKRDSHDTCSGESPQRGMGWTRIFHFFRSCSWDWCQSRAQKTKLVHASTILLLRRPPCLNKHGSTRSTRRACRVETWRDELSGIWAYM